MAHRIVVWLATGFGVGYAPVAPGTFGSLLGLPLAWGVQRLGWPWWAYLGCVAAAYGVGVLAAAAAIDHFGKKDPGQVVIDEVVAILLTFAFAEVTWVSVPIGFLWFRLFDIWKPWPIRRLELSPRGWGIMNDDMLAGLYAGACLWVTLRVVEGFA